MRKSLVFAAFVAAILSIVNDAVDPASRALK